MPTRGVGIPDVLRPYLESEQPNSEGEIGMHCPLHDDKRRSASINFEKGYWYCNACEMGGTIKDLLAQVKDRSQQVAYFVDAESLKQATNGNVKPVPTEGSVSGWHSALMSNAEALEELQSARGLTNETLATYQIGWDADKHAYTIPVRDKDGELVNVRFYDLHPRDLRRKIWGVDGHNTPVLYPIEQLEHPKILICEGEWDALIAIQNGFPAITRTGAARVWNNAWSGLFEGKEVYICHDRDFTGEIANRKVARAVELHAKKVVLVQLPYPITEKHGKDLTDYFYIDGHSQDDFRRAVKESNGKVVQYDPDNYTDIDVLDSFNSDSYGKMLRMRVTVTGKRSPTYLLPEKVEYTCSMDAGIKCQTCPLMELQGHTSREIQAEDPILLEMMGSSNKAVIDLLRVSIGAPKCGRLAIEMMKLRSVEELMARPSVEIARVQKGDSVYINRRIVSVGRHNTLANSTVEVIGSVFPNPKTQHNEFQAWDLARTETSIDKFEVTPENFKAMLQFRPHPGQRPMMKLKEIADDLATNVTRIYGRNLMHAAMDLVYHSALQFTFDGTRLQRGWLELLVVGDTRTGKSDVGQRLIEHYSAGEMVTCESATYAGVVGGLQQLASGKEWEVTWGAIPINDRRLVILDEIGGLTTDQIAQMSSIRSSGEAQLTKIRSERTWARTRLIWMGNPRNGRMSDYTYGVQAIRPLIGNNEDIARFDLAMSVGASEVDARSINKHRPEGKPRYSSDDCQILLQWAWSRTAENVLWEPSAVPAVYAAAMDMGSRYIEDPPLVQSANIRVKIARVAVALAIRTFSSDESGENVIVTKTHVEDAVQIMDLMYGLKGFGYREHSQELLKDLEEGTQYKEETVKFLALHPGLKKFLRMVAGRFRVQDMSDMMNMDRDETGIVINQLWEYKMITRRGPEMRIQPALHEIIREIDD